MTTTIDADRLDSLIASWELQQDAYVADRAGRFAVAIDALSYARPDAATIVDLAAGLGSFSKLVLQRFPDARVVAIDYDPALLSLARHNLREFVDRVRVVEADLMDPAWTRVIDQERPDGFVSSTALHWLPTGRLAALYEELAGALPSGGIVLNADHLSLSAEGSVIRAVCEADDSRQQEASFGAGAQAWDTWWDTLRAEPGFAELVAERDRRFAGSSSPRDTTAAFHVEALRVGGFTEAGTLWQRFDDYVVYAVR